MIPFLKQNKILSLFLLVLLIGGVYYGFFVDKNNNPLLTSELAPSADSQKLLVVLANLRTIKLDDALFDDPVFLSLSDYGVSLLPEAAGRHNPFLPFTVNFGAKPQQPQISLPSTRQTVQGH